jgi:hypothetical protein
VSLARCRARTSPVVMQPPVRRERPRGGDEIEAGSGGFAGGEEPARRGRGGGKARGGRMGSEVEENSLFPNPSGL